MRLTDYTDYSLRVMLYLAVRPEGLSTIQDISDAYGISKNHLMKVVQRLGELGWVETVRGRNGGVRLGRPATDISLFDIVRVTEDSFAMAECFEDDGDVDCPLIDSCGLNSALRKALNAFFEVLMQYSIDDLVKARPQINFLLGIEDFKLPAVLAVAPAA